MSRISLGAFVFCALAQAQNPDHIREVNLARAKSLPSFVADEVIVRCRSPHTEPPKWERVDTIESEIAVQGDSHFSRTNVRQNGKASTKSTFSGFFMSPQFGTELKPLFDPDCHTAIEFEGPEELNGRKVLVYRFSAKPGGCFGAFLMKNGYFSREKIYNPARTGRFKVEEPGGNVIYYEEEAFEFPKGFGQDLTRQILKWDYVKIGDSSYLLPVSAETFSGAVREDLWHITVQYKNHRHFEASSEITFH